MRGSRCRRPVASPPSLKPAGRRLAVRAQLTSPTAQDCCAALSKIEWSWDHGHACLTSWTGTLAGMRSTPPAAVPIRRSLAFCLARSGRPRQPDIDLWEAARRRVGGGLAQLLLDPGRTVYQVMGASNHAPRSRRSCADAWSLSASTWALNSTSCGMPLSFATSATTPSSRSVRTSASQWRTSISVRDRPPNGSSGPTRTRAVSSMSATGAAAAPLLLVRPRSSNRTTRRPSSRTAWCSADTDRPRASRSSTSTNVRSRVTSAIR